jgi:hypothetical protein
MPSLYSISGNAGVAGATISWSGTSSGSTTADGSGNYSITGLLNGSYTVTPSYAGYVFSPINANTIINYASLTGVNFTATSADVTFSWIRRTRLGGAWADSVGTVPLNETTEVYDLEIWDSTWSTIKRTVTALTSPSYAYTGAQQFSDFGAYPSSFNIKVYQVSAVVGRGFPGIATVTP